MIKSTCHSKKLASTKFSKYLHFIQARDFWAFWCHKLAFKYQDRHSMYYFFEKWLHTFYKDFQNYHNISGIRIFILYLGPDHVQLTKVNWRLKVNWKNFQEFFWKFFPIDFIVVNHVLWVNSIENIKSQLQTSKVNCKLQISYTILRTNSYFCLFLLLISRKRKRNLNYEFVESYKP